MAALHRQVRHNPQNKHDVIPRRRGSLLNAHAVCALAQRRSLPLVSRETLVLQEAHNETVFSMLVPPASSGHAVRKKAAGAEPTAEHLSELALLHR